MHVLLLVAAKYDTPQYCSLCTNVAEKIESTGKICCINMNPREKKLVPPIRVASFHVAVKPYQMLLRVANTKKVFASK